MNLKRERLMNGSETIASQLLFGRKGMELKLNDDNYAKNLTHERGNEAIGKALAYITESTVTFGQFKTCFSDLAILGVEDWKPKEKESTEDGE